MKGKTYLLITRILIIAGAIAGFVLFSMYSTNLPKAAEYIVCTLFFVTGIIGIVERAKRSRLCIVLGSVLLILAIGSIPAMFLLGKGSISFGLLVSALASIVVVGFYLNGATLNSNGRKTDVYQYIR